MCSGREFQVSAAATGKARLPTVTSKLHVVRIVRVWCMNCDAANNTPIYITPVSMSLTLAELASRFSSVFSSESSTLRLSASSSRCRSFAISFSCTTQHKQAPVTCMEQATRHKIGHSETFFSANLLARYWKETKPNKTNNRNQRNLN